MTSEDAARGGWLAHHRGEVVGIPAPEDAWRRLAEAETALLSGADAPDAHLRRRAALRAVVEAGLLPHVAAPAG